MLFETNNIFKDPQVILSSKQWCIISWSHRQPAAFRDDCLASCPRCPLRPSWIGCGRRMDKTPQGPHQNESLRHRYDGQQDSNNGRYRPTLLAPVSSEVGSWAEAGSPNLAYLQPNLIIFLTKNSRTLKIQSQNCHRQPLQRPAPQIIWRR